MIKSASGAPLLRIGAAGVGYNSFIEPAVWLANHLAEKAPAPQIWIDHHFTAKNFRDGLRHLAMGDSDICLVNTRGLCEMAARGKGLFDTPFPSLRALFTLPHHDWCVFAVDRSLDVLSFADLKKKKPALKVATGFLDGDNVIGWLCHEVLRRHGIEPDSILSWGGQYLDQGVTRSRHLVMEGTANAIFEEATFGERFKQIFVKRDMACLSIEPEVARSMEVDYGWPFYTVPSGFYNGQSEPLLCADASGWLLCCRDDLDDDLAFEIARIVVEFGSELGDGQLHRNDQVILTGPLPRLNLNDVVDTSPLQLHSGAERLFREKGLLKA